MFKVLIDGNNLAARSYWAMKQLATSDNTPSGMVYGFFNGLNYVRNELNADESDLIVVFDGGKSEHRMKLYPDYKMNRGNQKTVDEQLSYAYQLNQIRLGLAHQGIRYAVAPGVEADDIIGILSFEYQADRVVIYSGDHDFYQLITTNVSVMDPKAGILDAAYMEKTYGPHYFAKFMEEKALTGDSSDNIKGIQGIGEVRAKVVTQHADFFNGHWKTKGEITPQVQKYLLKAEEGFDILQRNIRLMLLPRTWKESFYDERQQEMVEAKLKSSTEHPDPIEFFKFLDKWEIKTSWR